MKKLFLAALVAAAFASPAHALTGFCSFGANGCETYSRGLNDLMQLNPVFISTPAYDVAGFTEANYEALGFGEYYVITNGNYDGAAYSAPNALTVNAIKQLKNIVDGKFNTPTGTASQYVRGDGSLATLPGGGSKTFNYPSRALNTCYQISSTKDADFHYKVDVATGLSLTTGAQGTVTATSYTNSSCTTGAQVIADGTAAQTGTLVVGLGVNQAVSVGLDGTLPAGKWVKITTANNVGTPTFTMRSVQSEVVQP